MRLDSAARAAGAALVGLALAACATPPPVYRPIGPKTALGYRDTPNADGSHTVLVVALTAATAHEFWDRRAHELCGETFHKNIFRAEVPVVTVHGYASNGYSGGSYAVDQYGLLHLEGYLRCETAAATAEPAVSAPPEIPAVTIAETPAQPPAESAPLAAATPVTP
ncbi:MAG: hypothetical protein IV086_11975 [Hyphomonadaceae bacterium]|nr:MAG: hypothetical protein FD160_1915 [Caulobacteraceae bacterium]MBT9446408.1 hypothetical protein [Hyphomonadaceae bacterium]TPW06786.1 MAG: hypothetical protein FD124_1586 [Alphaproteobacteria bacterium]